MSNWITTENIENAGILISRLIKGETIEEDKYKENYRDINTNRIINTLSNDLEVIEIKRNSISLNASGKREFTSDSTKNSKIIILMMIKKKLYEDFLLPALHGKDEARIHLNKDIFNCFHYFKFFENNIDNILLKLKYKATKLPDSIKKTEIGKIGEYFSTLYEKSRTGLDPEWSSENNMHQVWDIKSCINKANNTNLFIEVKTSTRDTPLIKISREQVNFLTSKINIRLHIWIIKNPIVKLLILDSLDEIAGCLKLYPNQKNDPEIIIKLDNKIFFNDIEITKYELIESFEFKNEIERLLKDF